jgi:hypothetical protein
VLSFFIITYRKRLPLAVPQTVPEMDKSAGLRDDAGSQPEGAIMDIREAVLEDTHELQKLQAQCPQGRSLIVSTVNTPDFFARVKAYESYKVYVAKMLLPLSK